MLQKVGYNEQEQQKNTCKNAPWIGENYLNIYDSELLKIYPRSFLFSLPGSGKTSLQIDIIKNISHKKYTQIYYISSTLDYDNTIKNNEGFFDQWLVDKQSDISDEILQKIMDSCFERNKIIEEGNDEISMKIRKKLKKEQFPLHILVLDDIDRHFLRKSRILEQVIKKSRHMKCVLFFSSQYLCDLSVPLRVCCDVFFLFHRMSQKIIKERVYNETCLNISSQDLLKIYLELKRYDFLAIVKREGKIIVKKNNTLYQLKDT